MRWSAAPPAPPVASAALAMLLVAGLSGCIQVEVPQAAGAPAASPPATAAAPATYPVACVLLDEAGAALPQGTCEYRFGTLGARVAVNATGVAVRNVPAGASGTVAGSAPGRAPAQAPVEATGPKTVRMTLPAQASGAGPAPQAPPAASDDPADNQTLQHANATAAPPEVFEPALVTLLDETYVAAPAELPTLTYTFDAPARLDTLEVVGIYEYAPFATLPDIRLLGPDGQEVGRHTQLLYSPYPVAGNAKEIPMLYVLGPDAGTYRLEVGGASTTPIRLVATGYSGRAPDFSFTPLDGPSRTLSSYRGSVVLVDLMATWCGPCHDAMPGLKRLAEDYGDRLTILSVDIDETETRDELAAMQSQYGAEWTWGFEDDGTASSAYGSGYIPTFGIVDARGGLVYRQVGAVDEDLARELIDAALARSGG